MATYLANFSKESEVSRLRAENHSLAEELAQCQADKEFVWSLWKRLQVANPDITQAIGMVIQREKEKAELKDRKILEILQTKDDKLADLENLVSKLNRELAELSTQKVEYQDLAIRKEAEAIDFKDREKRLQTRVDELESKTREESSRQAIRELDQQMLDLKQQLAKRDGEIERLTRDKDDLSAIRDSQKERMGAIEHENKHIGQNYDALVKEHKEAKKLLMKYEKELSSKQKNSATKDEELESVRKELSELWETHRQTTEHSAQQAELIKQLQGLQKDTEKMLQNQEEAYKMETLSLTSMYQANRFTDIELRQQNQAMKKKLEEQEDMIVELQRQLAEMIGSSTGMMGFKDTQSDSDIEGRIQNLQSEVKSLKHRLDDKSSIQTRDRSVSPIRIAKSRTRSASPRKLTKHSRSKSYDANQHQEMSPHTESDVRVLQNRLENTQRRLGDAQKALHVKTKELEETRIAHERRIDRLKSLQTNYKLVKQQLQTLEEEINGPPKRKSDVPKKRKKKLRRSDPKSLQKEDSDAVWNELSYFKNENRNLKVECMNLQEEVDVLRVKSAQDGANIHELQTRLEQEREELDMLGGSPDRSSTPVPDVDPEEMKELQNQVNRLTVRLKSIHSDCRKLKEERDKLGEENRCNRQEINLLKQLDAEHRVKVADLNKELARCNRELRKRKKRKFTNVGAQYQKTLNHSIQKMSLVFDEFDKEGWEDVSEGDNTGTTESLGAAIANRANASLRDDDDMYSTDDSGMTPTPMRLSPQRPPGRQIESVEDHIKRMSKRNESPVRDVPPVRKVTVTPARRYHDRAVSPIHFSPVMEQPPKKHKTGNAGRQLAVLKQRVSGLQNQLTILRIAKETASRNLADANKTISTLRSDLQTSNARLQATRVSSQRLSSELEQIKGDKEELEEQMGDFSVNMHTEQEWLNLHNRLKNSTIEVSKQLQMIKQFKQENMELQEKIHKFQERVKHLERDLSQKRVLMEDMKIKMKVTEENAQAEQHAMTDVEARIQSLQDSNQRYKTQIDSLKAQIHAVQKEKYDNEDKIIRLSDEIQRKSRQVSELQKKNGELNATIGAVEQTAQAQLHALANQSEVAIDTAHSKVTQVTAKLAEFHKFIRIFAHALLSSVQQSRRLIQHQKQIKQRKNLEKQREDLDPSMRKAQSLAYDILNISESEFDDLMSVNSRDDQSDAESDVTGKDDVKKDKRWHQKWERALKTQEDFAVLIVELFMEKVEEKSSLTADLTIL